MSDLNDLYLEMFEYTSFVTGFHTYNGERDKLNVIKLLQVGGFYYPQEKYEALPLTKTTTISGIPHVYVDAQDKEDFEGWLPITFDKKEYL